MFWGVTLENDKRYTQTVEASFHLSMAALDPNPPSTADVSKTVSLWLQHDKAEFLLCTLEYGKLYQQPLDCNFTEGEEVTFFVNGQGVIHLTGYLIEDMTMADESMVEPMVSTSSDEEDDDSEESEDIPVLVDAKQFAKGAKKRTKEMKAGTQKKIKVEGEDKDSDESSSDYSESGDDDDDEEDEDVEEDDSSEDDSTEESDDSETNKITSKKALKGKSENGKKNNPNLKQKLTTAVTEQKLSKKLKNKEKKNILMPSAEDEESLEKALMDTSMASEKKKKKKKKKPAKTSEAPNSSTSNNKQDLAASSEDAKNTTRVLSSGLIIEDTQVGQGSEARIGRQVHVYYSGKLAKNGKKFDSCSSGKPFRFMLGRGEVITGWDKGLVGMRVGGKRKLTVPAKLGYGSQQAGPIPPNSSLVFDIELKAIS